MTDGNAGAGDKKPLRAVQAATQTRPKAGIDESAPAHIFSEIRHSPERIRELFRTGQYP